MQYKQLGNTDIQVSSIAFGAMGLVPDRDGGADQEKEFADALRAAYDGGITLFDTAEAYGKGESERVLGRGLRDVREKVLFATKVSPAHLDRVSLVASCEQSLQNLQTDRIDLYQIHWANPGIPLDETFGALERLKEQGKIRACGVSNFGTADLGSAVASDRALCSNQVSYSLLFRAVEDGIRPFCAKQGISILCYSPLMQALLTGKYSGPDDVPQDRARTRHFSGTRPLSRHGEKGVEDLTFQTIERIRAVADEACRSMADLSLAWLLAQPGVTSVIVGARNAGQADRNVRAANNRLELEIVERLSAETDELKTTLGDNADMWQGKSRIR